MTLRQRILDVLGKQAMVPGRDLYGRLPDVERSALDYALGGLLRDKQIARVDGVYSLPGVTPRFSGLRLLTPPNSIPAGPATQVCRECKGDKPVEEFDLRSSGKRAQRCNGCRAERTREALRRTAALIQANEASKQPVIANRVFEKALFEQKAVLNRIGLLEAELVKLRVRLSRCDEVIGMRGRYGEGAA